MNRLGKWCHRFSAAASLVLLVVGLAGPVFGDTKPKFVYVANSGAANPQTTIKTFQFSGTATCSNYPCAATLSITGSFTVTSSSVNGWVSTGTLFLTDSQDLASSPLGLSHGYNPGSLSTSPLGLFGVGEPNSSNVELFFPFSSFPTTYTGGMLCTLAGSSGCGNISEVVIGPSDMSPSLLAATGGIPITAQITSATITMTTSLEGSNTVSGYSVDSKTGTLSLIPGSPFTVGTNPASMVLDPSSKFVYVANQGSNNVSAFAVNATTGALNQVPGSPFAAGKSPHAIAVDRSGKFVYVANEGSSNVSAYKIDTETGTLTPVSGSPFPAGDTPIAVTIDPAAGFIYVLNNNANVPSWSTSAYSMDGSTGVLTPISSSNIATTLGPLAATIDPAGKFLYEIGYFNPHWGVSPFTINTATGSLTEDLGGSGNVLPSAMAMNPTGKFLYVTDASFGYIVAFAVDATTGAITIIPGSADDNYGQWSIPAGPYAMGTQPDSIQVDPSGRFAYVANQGSNNVSAFVINGTTGALTPVPGTPFAAGVGPSSVAIASSPASVAFETFKAKVDLDEDRKTTFLVDGFFTLGSGSDGIYPLSETVELQVGSYSVTLPAGSFRERGRHEYEFNGTINDVDLKIRIYQFQERVRGVGKEEVYLFTAEGRGNILKGTKNPVAVGLTIGDDEGSATVRADIDK
jgi:6-phosphogluconolactonase (cycloisomerase 2 family)